MLKNIKKGFFIIAITFALFLVISIVFNLIFKGPIPYAIFFNNYSYTNFYKLLNINKYSNYKTSRVNKNISKISDVSEKKFIFPCYEGEKQFIEIYLDKNYFKNNKNKFYETSDNILLGDSFLFGYCVEYESSITGLIRSNNIENILELSYPGTTIDSQFYYLKKYVKNKNLKNIIIFFYENNDLNFEEKKLEILDRNRIKELKKLQELNNKNLVNFKNKNNSVKLSFNDNLKIFLATSIRGLNSFKNHFLKFRNKSIDNSLIEKYFSFIDNNQDYLKNTKIHIVYLTTWERYQYPEWHNKVKFYDSIFEKMKIYSLKNNINLIDCRKSIQSMQDLIFEHNFYSHYNKLGYRKIYDCLVKNEIKFH